MAFDPWACVMSVEDDGGVTGPDVGLVAVHLEETLIINSYEASVKDK